jgi:hypothetical protein
LSNWFSPPAEAVLAEFVAAVDALTLGTLSTTGTALVLTVMLIWLAPFLQVDVD